jgi:hypothetical protein
MTFNGPPHWVHTSISILNTRFRRCTHIIVALRHDWLHRLRVVLNTLKLPETDAMIAREKRLESIAKEALGSTAGATPEIDLRERV